MTTPKRIYSLDAPDQARLKIARIEIEAILKKHDLGGAVVLHTPGMAEWFYDIQPSYSCARIDEKERAVRVRSQLADYGGDAEAQKNDQAATAQMLHAIGENCAMAALMFLDASKVVDEVCQVLAHTRGKRIADPLKGPGNEQ